MSINFVDHNIPADHTGRLAVCWNNDTKEFFFTNSWGYDIWDCLNKTSGSTRWEYDFAANDLQDDVDLFKKKGFTLINKVKYLVTYKEDKYYTKEYLILLAKEIQKTY